MPDFPNPVATWNARYDREDYLFGEEPNAFLQRHAHHLRPGGSVLCVADGEGRNSVWLAQQGMAVTAFDFAPNAVAKAKRLAARSGVHVDHHLSDAYAWPWTSATYGAVVAIFIQFVAPEKRETLFAGIRSAVAPGGLLLLEGYRPEQVDYGTGGPPRRDHMYTREWLEQVFGDWEIVVLDAYDTVIHEGAAHGGMSALIDLVARKPA
jgi:cyclopropane fatty-acyl-phospholipid synthase-like methyltransferase